MQLVELHFFVLYIVLFTKF